MKDYELVSHDYDGLAPVSRSLALRTVFANQHSRAFTAL